MHALIRKLPPSITALLLQLIAILLAFLGFGIAGITINALLLAFVCGLLAALLSYAAGLARWWLWIQLFFAPALVLMLRANIPSDIFLAAFIVMLLVYWSTFRSQVPLYLSSKRVWITLEDLLPEAGTHFKFLDIGSGMGGVLTHLARKRPEGQYFGVENAPLPFFFSKLKIQLGRYQNCHVQWASMWDSDLSQYDVVFAYLSPVPMARLWQKAKQEMRGGSLFVSNSFVVKQHPPHYSITLDDMHRSTLYVWHM
jgi:precorrin-6B methylase 2